MEGNENMNDTADNAESITNVMDALGGSTKPEAEPEKTGDKAEGTKESEQKPQENPKWMAQLDGESLKDKALIDQLKNFQNIGELARAYNDLNKQKENSVNLPGSESGEEEVKAFYQKLGMPESADGYSVTDEESKPLRDLAFRHNLTEAQFAGLYKGLAEIGAEAVKANNASLEKMRTETDAALKAEWGKEYKLNLEFLKRGIAAYGGKELGAKLKASGLLYDADIVKMFASLGRQNAESQATTKGAGGGRHEYKSTADGGHFDFGI